MKLVRAILDQVCSVHEILPLWSRTYQWTVKYNFLYGKINLDRILWHYGSMQFGCFIQNPVQDTWATLLCELFRIESTVYFSQNLLWTCSSASLYSKHSVSFWVCLSVVFLKMRLFWVQMHCFGQVSRAILDQVCSVHEILPLWSRTYQWTVKYNFLYGKINLDRILWHYGSMQFGCFIQNPVQDSWAALLCELVRIESTVYFSQNLLWTCSSASLYSKHSVSFWVCLSVVFLKMRLLWVQMHCFGQVR